MFDLGTLVEAAGKAAGADVALATAEELFAAAVELERARSLVETAEAHVLARLDAEDLCDREHGLCTSSWLAHAADQPRGMCRRRVRTARALARLEHVDREVSDRGAHLSHAHADVVAGAMNPRNADSLVEAQVPLVELAGKLPFDQWAAAVRDLANALDADGGYDPHEDIHANRLHLETLADRTVEIRGRLVGEAAVVVPQVLERLADELFRTFASDHTVDPELVIPARPTLLALALAEACRRAGAVEVGSTRQPRTEAVWVIHDTRDVAALDGTRLPTLEHLKCDQRIQAALLDSLGNPVDLGQRTELVSPEQRRALAIRDRGCIFPGCDRPPGWCDAHHVVHRKDGGPTVLHNLGPLCRHHHLVVHRRGWAMVADPDRPGQFLIITPAGLILPTQRNGR